ncbi:MAG: cation:proton antiporter [Microcoleus sp. PH2017_25_DOB_D_A]|uniref:cation:proton antiporter n=1 Tax=unclassified Microcoleus TaxID=2642155 RepID=UPI001DA60611|nr:MULTISPECIES: cation:proton antiporter [unclassified Microcoleus]TAE07299.1 MAG: cation:proton antiporter [Oscillatoriales cyanobacterium]MCC3494212.1 cation:proton antiporter [Microcoleus sp. PH2017_16_JOR_D_A]MCC3537971.1 cation:proton antiporter [Microcoleus sp. PH2017_25_DOB_D_A]MCC3550344.1 cation:proton antiporter [Microcoleus sp. PH2017_24_DOB_U_A]MCC3569355.1 cation:proton antiporter [Microcoleus sp. PH2017_31_RDM_U_A]
MNIITIAWLTIPFFIGFVIYLLPKLDKYLALAVTFVSAGYALQLFLEKSPLKLNLLDNFGVQVVADQLGAYFILTNALVTAAVIFYCWHSGKSAFFYSQMIILHGSINATFICADFISLYVALEVSGIAAFLLIAYPRTDRSLWVALRYLFVSNTAMLFYLVGAVLVYQKHNSFVFDGLKGAPPEALALIFLGLLLKGGIFVSGFWLPLTHSESETPVSALLSGIVIKASILPLLRCALVSDDIDTIVRIFGVATALMGVSYAIFEKDTKRMLAFSTIAQLGFILAAPEVGGFYALTHGLVKSSLFLIAGSLPSRNFKELQSKAIDPKIWIALVIASLSISGFPLLAGFGAKVLTLKSVAPWQAIPMNIAAVGTAITFAKLIFIPRGEKQEVKPGLWPAVILLIGGLIIANVVYLDAYSIESIIKAVGTIAIGWLIYVLIIKRLAIALPRAAEQFDHLVGVMTLTLIVLFWMALATGTHT